ncbi:hypothetical protein BSKO_03630 [Bryopsis sp. KO-2023]|nr:hypothetical protein BSKO_03630 [Bryopsis sp. KO-2023]
MDDDDEQRAVLALKELSNTDEIAKMRNAAKECLLKGGTADVEDIMSRVREALDLQGFKTKIENFGFSYARGLGVQHAKFASQGCLQKRSHSEQEKSSCTQRTNSDHEHIWKRLLMDRLCALREATGVPYVRPPRRPEEAERLRLQSAGHTSAQRIGEMDSPFSSPRISLVTSFLYSGEDFFHALMDIGKILRRNASVPINQVSLLPQRRPDDSPENKPPSDTRSNPSENGESFRTVKKMIDVPTRAEMAKFLKELSIEERHLGVDDLVCPWFRDQHNSRSQKVRDKGSIVECWKLARFGVPNPLRPDIWKIALGLPSTTKADHQYFESLCESVEEQEMLTDLLIEHDLQVLSGSQHFFPFEETLRSVLLAFSRDPAIGQCSSIPSVHFINAGTDETDMQYPPSGVLPFKGLIMLAAPLCMVYDDPTDVFVVFRSMYCRFWSRLMSFSLEGLPQPSLTGLCNIFESFILEIDPEVYHHLHLLGCPALQIAFPWIFGAFVGYLCIEELLLLWDRLLGWDSLVILPVLAAAVMTFRRKLLLDAKTADDLEEIIDDLSHIKIIPLLQSVLAVE